MGGYILIAITILFFIVIFYSIFKERKKDNEGNSTSINNKANNQIYPSPKYDANTYSKNKVAILLKIFSIIILIVGIIVGIIQLDTYSILGISYIIVSIILSIFIYGLGEIVQLLEDIKNK